MNKKTYNSKTGNGWKYVKGKWIFYEKGKVAQDQNPGMTKLRKLLIDDTISMPIRGAKNLLSIGKEVTAPLRSGFQTIVDKSTSDPNSLTEFGEVLSTYDANRRRQLALQQAQFTLSQQKAQDFFLSESDDAKTTNTNLAKQVNNTITKPSFLEQQIEGNPNLRWLNKTQDQNVVNQETPNLGPDFDSSRIVKGPYNKEKEKEKLKIEESKINPKLERAYKIVARHASGKNSIALQKAKLYIRQHGG